MLITPDTFRLLLLLQRILFSSLLQIVVIGQEMSSNLWHNGFDFKNSPNVLGKKHIYNSDNGLGLRTVINATLR